MSKQNLIIAATVLVISAACALILLDKYLSVDDSDSISQGAQNADEVVEIALTEGSTFSGSHIIIGRDGTGESGSGSGGGGYSSEIKKLTSQEIEKIFTVVLSRFDMFVDTEADVMGDTPDEIHYTFFVSNKSGILIQRHFSNSDFVRSKDCMETKCSDDFLSAVKEFKVLWESLGITSQKSGI